MGRVPSFGFWLVGTNMGLRTALGLRKKAVVTPEITALFEGKEFTSDWTSDNIPVWQDHLHDILDKPVQILEIGSFEGRSAVAFLKLFPHSQMTCVDPWPGACHNRFIQNTAEFGDRVTRFRSPSEKVLPNFIVDQKSFDLIYIDGDHTEAGAIVDSLMCWPLLKVGGYVIWDDYLWQTQLPRMGRPQAAVDWFIKSHRSDLKVLYRRYQVIGQKVG